MPDGPPDRVLPAGQRRSLDRPNLPIELPAVRPVPTEPGAAGARSGCAVAGMLVLTPRWNHVSASWHRHVVDQRSGFAGDAVAVAVHLRPISGLPPIERGGTGGAGGRAIRVIRVAWGGGRRWLS